MRLLLLLVLLFPLVLSLLFYYDHYCYCSYYRCYYWHCYCYCYYSYHYWYSCCSLLLRLLLSTLVRSTPQKKVYVFFGYIGSGSRGLGFRNPGTKKSIHVQYSNIGLMLLLAAGLGSVRACTKRRAAPPRSTVPPL